jgi:ribose transport system ATP-binding protein
MVSLSAQHIIKRFGGVTALADGCLDVRSGEVLALMGANGSGKSTLSKIINGVVAPDAGDLTLDGQVMRFRGPLAARRRGIAAVYQELSLVPDLTVAENIWLGHEPLRWGYRRGGDIRARTEALIDLFAGTVRADLRPDTPARLLPPDEQQIVEILKALSREPRLIILDEATASLDSRQVQRLFDLVADWKQRGKAVVFISHRMEEVFRVADSATVLRSGSTVGSVALAGTSESELVQMMIEGGVVARQITHTAPQLNRAPRLELTNLRTEMLRGIDLTLHEGELLGLGGLRGQGQSDLLLAIFGAIPFSGAMTLGGAPSRFTHPQQAMRAGLAFVPGNRGSQGLLAVRSILENLLIPSWRRYKFPLQMRQARADAANVGQELRLVMASLDAPVSSLSGGNAQKVVLGKWLLRKPQILLLDDPTKGVDVGAKGEFYKILDDLRASGTAIILYSSDDEELLGLCDRVLVLHDGQINAELSGPTLTRADLVAASLGTPHSAEG